MLRSRGVSALVAAVVMSCAGLPSTAALAQGAAASGGNAGWFVPKSAQPAAGTAAPRGPARTAPVPLPAAPADSDDAQSQTPPVLPMPPVPASPDIPRGVAPPVPVIGVISVPDVMRLSSAAQQAERVLGARRDELARDAQKEQGGWRDEQQKLQAQAKNMASDQIQLRERRLQERVIAAQRDFRNRNRIIQEAAQVSLNQIERELVQILRQVAGSRGMNLVLHREQVALSQDGLDITQQVADQLNKVLPTVFIPAANVDPEELAKSGTMPTTADAGRQAAPAPTPAPVAATARH
ncbi:outer membrane chaperone Skp (OmpH) [Gluconacetobacter diazotrophicus PA1 5]|nr:OmpH family outer membrane protein [Gluconacetobacter diazotrophicus]ACI50160.1 outer membrane chaperone Skp (OmpH) [Gluconacetobacter diazotrophicus PA1 5]MBB2154920.1 OmpH family outer membrane protein [Gluconacetobacter diazotrophicus]TWB08084.1 periplasmic chaperone for outer membrane proteins Skp [Gluconacetobacter diazotrophicus]